VTTNLPPSAAAANLGTCWGTPNGQSLSMPAYMASGYQCVAEAVLRRWTTNSGGLIDDPNYGRNVTDSVNADLGPSEIDRWQQQLGAEAEKDERVRRCLVTVSLTVAGLLMVVAQITTSAGPFRMVVSVADVTPTLLLVSAT
jgi:hypothetical protein